MALVFFNRIEEDVRKNYIGEIVGVFASQNIDNPSLVLMCNDLKVRRIPVKDVIVCLDYTTFKEYLLAVKSNKETPLNTQEMALLPDNP